MVELRGFEPLTPSLRTRCSARLSYSPFRECEFYRSGRSTKVERIRTGYGPYYLRFDSLRRSSRNLSCTTVAVTSERDRSTRERDTSVVRRRPLVIPSG